MVSITPELRIAEICQPQERQDLDGMWRRHISCQIMRRRKERGESQLEIEKLPQGLVGAARWDAETCVSSSSFQASLAFEPESIDATV